MVRLTRLMTLSGMKRCPLTGEIFVGDEQKYFKYCDAIFKGNEKKHIKLDGALGERLCNAMKVSTSAADFFERTMEHLRYKKPVLDVQQVAFNRQNKAYTGLITTEGTVGKLFGKKGFRDDLLALDGKSVRQITSPQQKSTEQLTSGSGESPAPAVVPEPEACELDFDYRVASGIELSAEQRKVLDLALMGYNIFVSGSAGTGKSILLREIARIMTGLGLKVLLTAPRALAALNIDGVTIQSCFGIAYNKPEKARSVDVVIVDEVSLLKGSSFERLYHTCRRSKKEWRKNFGGIQLILAGDFLQLSGSRSALPLFRSRYFMDAFLHLRLLQPHRLFATTPRHAKFAHVLQEVRTGNIPWGAMKECMQVVPFGDPTPEDSVATRIFFDPEQEDLHNQEKLDELPGEPLSYPTHCSKLSLDGIWTVVAVTKLSKPVIGQNRVNEIQIDEIADRINSMARELIPQYIPSLHGPVVVGFRVDSEFLRANIYEFQRGIHAVGQQDCFCGFRARIIPALGKSSFELFNMIQHELEVRGMPIVGKVAADILPETLKERLMTGAERTILGETNLKLGAQVMVTGNVSSCVPNGSMGVVVDFESTSSRHISALTYSKLLRESLEFSVPKFPKVRFNNGETEMILPRQKTIGGTPFYKYVKGYTLQVPLTLCYGLYYNKIQGLTITNPLLIDFKKVKRLPQHSVYVALSRVRDPAQLTIANMQEEHVTVDATALDFEQKLLVFSDFKEIREDTPAYQHAKSDYRLSAEKAMDAPLTTATRSISQEYRVETLKNFFDDSAVSVE